MRNENEIDGMIQRLRGMGCAVIVITPEDIQALTEEGDDDESPYTLDQIDDWMLLHHDDVEEAIMGDYWGDTIRDLIDHYPIGKDCPNHDQGRHTPNEHNQCDDCREWLPVVKLNFNPQAWVNDYAMSVDAEGDTAWTVDRREFLKQFPTEADFNSKHQERDDLRHEGNAPEWVREWSGPFEVELLDCDVWETTDA